MQKQLVLTGREVEEYEAWHRDFSYFRNKCWRLEEEIDKYKKREEREKPMRKYLKMAFAIVLNVIMWLIITFHSKDIVTDVDKDYQKEV